MKKINYIYTLLGILSLAFISCDEDTNDFVPELAPTAAVEITTTQSADSQCNLDITFTVQQPSTVYYAPQVTETFGNTDSDLLFAQGDPIVFNEAGSSSITLVNLPEGLDLTIAAISVNEDGTRSAQVFSERYVQPSYVIEPKATYSGDTASSEIGLPPGVAPAYSVTLTAVSGEDNTFDIDTAWGPDYASWLCGCGINPGDYPGPIRIQIDPSTFDITVMSGGEAAGQGYVFDIPYSISGTGTYDPCTKNIDLVLNDPDIFGLTYEVSYR